MDATSWQVECIHQLDDVMGCINSPCFWLCSSGVAMREQRNPQFDFLKPTHMLFSYFTSLVDSYMKVINPSAELLAKVSSDWSTFPL